MRFAGQRALAESACGERLHRAKEKLKTTGIHFGEIHNEKEIVILPRSPRCRYGRADKQLQWCAMQTHHLPKQHLANGVAVLTRISKSEVLT